MRLLRLGDGDELILTKKLTRDIPPYAILSHTWSEDEEDEVTFEDIEASCFQHKAGYKKILFCGNQARRDGLEYFWVDTCCINKSSSAELTEAINSMFQWYQNAQKCYVYLADVHWGGGSADELARSTWKIDFRKSRWFTRGWTLQELIAPAVVEFFSADGHSLGKKTTLEQLIHEITRIPIRALQQPLTDEFNIETRMSWAKGRATSKGEDRAYCLLGILGVSMSWIYGEGEEKALKRLQRILAADADRLGEDIQLEESINQCLANLRISDPQDDKSRIMSTKGGLLKDSSQWIFENPDFKEWRNNKNSSLLWIKGDPGKGKTMLLCDITDELVQSSTNQSLISYFFCQATDRNLNNATAVIRGLIYMLVRQDRCLAKHLHKEWTVAGSRLFEDANAWDALTRILTLMLRDCQSREVVLIIDALDECSGSDLPKLVNFITQRSQTDGAKWLVSSRNWPEIEDLFSSADRKVRLSLELNKDSITAAVKVYIRHKAEELRSAKGLDDTRYNRIVEYMNAHADDTFLWVALVVQRLKDTRVRARNMLTEIERFPLGLDGVYQRMLDSINGLLDAELSREVLSIISIVYRPISVAELSSLVEPGCFDDLTDLVEVVQACGSFLAIRDNVVYFVHQSAKDFLTTNAMNNVFPDGGIPTRHRYLGERSLEVLSKSLKRDPYNLRDPGISAIDISPPSWDPLAPLQYSCVFWVDHIVDGGFYNNCQSWKDTITGIDEFLQQQYLYWLEALSLLGAIPSGISSVVKLLQHTKDQRETEQLRESLFEAVRFCKYNGAVIAQYPLQAYAAALVFSPKNSLIRRKFRKEEPEVLILMPRVDTGWGSHLQTLEGHTSSVISVAFSHDSRLVASASADETVRIWDAEAGEQLQILEGHTSYVISVAFSHDSRLVASASSDKTVRIWDAEAGKQLQILEGHTSYVNSVAFSHDSRLVASASFDKTVRIWDAEAGEQLQILEGHTEAVISVAFSHDSRLVASASFDKTVRVWLVETGVSCQVLETGYVDQLHFDLSGTQLLTSTGAFSMVTQDNAISGGSDDSILQKHIMLDVPVSAKQCIGYGVSQDSRWITRDGNNVLRLPAEYRSEQSAVSGDTVVVGCSAGKVLIMRFESSHDVLPFREGSF